MKLLVPVDGSLASYNAVKEAVKIARTYGFGMKLIHVVDHENLTRHRRNEKLWRQVDGSAITGRTAEMGEDSFTDSLRDNGCELLESILDDLDVTDIKVEKEVLFGEPYRVIIDTAEKEGVDLVVMGNRGFSKIKRFFVGSVTQRVIAEATRPVLVIPTNTQE